MDSEINIVLRGQHFVLHKDKVVYWEEQDALLLSDIHAGKASLFRAHGIPLSSDHLLQDINRLNQMLEHYTPKRLYILGDLFHSTHNEENSFMANWLNTNTVATTVIQGNHDVHSKRSYGLNWVPELAIDKIFLQHEPPTIKADCLHIYGHIHPAYVLKGKAHQRLRLPCFHYSEEHICLPAFGQLTGHRTVAKGKKDEVVMISPEGLLKL